MKRTLGLAVALVLFGANAARADRIHLHGGGVIEGQLVDVRADAVEIEVGPGRMTVPRSRVLRLESGVSHLGAFRARAALLDARDAAGWVELGRWAHERGLLTQAREAFERALSSDPANAEANEALGRERVAGRWASYEEAQRARGLVPFEGSWVTPAERGAILLERTAASEARRAAAESDARVREAEARAAAAEADARRAEAEARAAAESGGVPYDWVLGGGPYGPVYGPVFGVPLGHGHKGRRHRDRDERPDPPRLAPPVASADEAGLSPRGDGPRKGGARGAGLKSRDR